MPFNDEKHIFLLVIVQIKTIFVLQFCMFYLIEIFLAFLLKKMTRTINQPSKLLSITIKIYNLE